MELQEFVKVLDFNEEDNENKKEIASIFKNYGDEIANEIADAFSKSPEVVKAIQQTNISFFEIRDRWLSMVETTLSSEFDEEFEKKFQEFSKSLTKMGIIKREFIALGISLIFIKLNDKILSLGLDRDKDLSKTLLRVLSAFLVKGMDLYSEQLTNLFLKFTGMSRELYERQIEVEAKKGL